MKSAAKKARISVWMAHFCGARLWAARRNLSHWIVGLGCGSAMAIGLSVALIFSFGAGPPVLFCAVVMAYAVCEIVAFLFLGDQSGENEQNRITARTNRFQLARETRDRDEEDLTRKRAILVQARAAKDAIDVYLKSAEYNRQLETNRLLNIDPGRLYPDEFERYIGDILRHLGFSVDLTGRSGDQGVDVVACRGELRVAVQAKRYIGSVGNSAVQEVYAGMAHHKCHRCMVITTAEFTRSAIELAESTGCILIGTTNIQSLIKGEIHL
jgi:HJR/Mrr/RecB family endonuclease